jgi:hypothetical protein
MDRLYKALHGVRESWRLTAGERYGLVEGVIENGSACGLSVNEVLDSKEARLHARLSLAARHLHSAEETNVMRKAQKAAAKYADPDRKDKSAVRSDARRKIRSAEFASSGRFEPPNSVNTAAFDHEKSSRLAGTTRKSLQTIPRQIDPSYRSTPHGGSEDDYNAANAAKKKHHDDNSKKFLHPDGTYRGAGYGPGRPIPHVHAKLAAHAKQDADDWEKDPEGKEVEIRKWSDAHRKKYGADPHNVKALRATADKAHDIYQDKLDARADGDNFEDKKLGAYNKEAHDIRVKEYGRRKDPKNWTSDGQGRKQFKSSDDIKRVRDSEKNLAWPKPEKPKADAAAKGNADHVWRKQGDFVKRRQARQYAYDTTSDCEHIDESCDQQDFKKKLNPKLNTPRIGALLNDLHTALRKTAKTEREAMGKALPSKYGGSDIVPLLRSEGPKC